MPPAPDNAVAAQAAAHAPTNGNGTIVRLPPWLGHLMEKWGLAGLFAGVICYVVLVQHPKAVTEQRDVAVRELGLLREQHKEDVSRVVASVERLAASVEKQTQAVELNQRLILQELRPKGRPDEGDPP